MKKEDVIRKLTSRKWWTSVAAFVVLVMQAAGASEGSAQQVAAIIMAGAVVIGYTLGEGLIDAKNVDADITTEVEVEQK